MNTSILKTLGQLAVICLAAAQCGCGKKQNETAQPAGAPPAEEPAKRPPPAWLDTSPPRPTPPPLPAPKQQTMTIVQKIPFGSAHSTPEEIQQLRKDVSLMTSNDVSRAARSFMGKRTPEGMREMIRLLDELESKIPDALPSQEEINAMESAVAQNHLQLPMEHWKVCYRKALELAVVLVMYDVEEAAQRGERFRELMKRKWGHLPQATNYLNSLEIEFRHAYADVKSGIMAWQERKFSE